MKRVCRGVGIKRFKRTRRRMCYWVEAGSWFLTRTHRPTQLFTIPPVFLSPGRKAATPRSSPESLKLVGLVLLLTISYSGYNLRIQDRSPQP